MGQRLVIHPQQPVTRHNVGKRNASIIEMVGWLYIDDKDPYPKEMRISLWPDRETGELPRPYEAGEYLVDSRVAALNQYGDPRYTHELKFVKKAATAA